MTTGEFDTLMQIVYSRWNAKSYPDAVKRRIWFFVKDLPQKSFEKIIYTLLDTSRVAPMPQEFKMLAYSEKDALGLRGSKEPETKPSAEAKCWDCGDAGNLFAESVDEKRTATFRCHCEVGRARPSAQGMVWDDRLDGMWRKIPIYPDVKGDWRPRNGLTLVKMVQETAGVRDNKKRTSTLTRAGDLLKRIADAPKPPAPGGGEGSGA